MPVISQDRLLLHIPSREIERVLQSQGSVTVPSSGDCSSADRLYWPALTMVGAYYDICFHYRQPPTQEQMISHYFAINRAAASKQSLATQASMRMRVARAYNSFIAEHHLLALCVESNQFDMCCKSEQLDISNSIDLLLGSNGIEVGIAIQVPSRNAQQWRSVKAKRQEVRNRCDEIMWTGYIHHLDMNFNEMQVIAGIHIFKPIPWIPRLRAILEDAKRNPMI